MKWNFYLGPRHPGQSLLQTGWSSRQLSTE